jgi:hypothetical protein
MQLVEKTIPKKHNTIYIPPSNLPLNSFEGGLCKVKKVIIDGEFHYIEVKQRPGHKYLWERYLDEYQDKMRGM